MITVRDAADGSGGAVMLPKLPVLADTQGRLRVTKAQRRDILAASERSGESQPRFARRVGLKYSTVARWVKLSRAKSTGSKPAIRLLEALVELPAAGTAVVLQLPGGVRLEVTQDAQIALAASLARALAKPCQVFPGV